MCLFTSPTQLNELFHSFLFDRRNIGGDVSKRKHTFFRSSFEVYTKEKDSSVGGDVSDYAIFHFHDRSTCSLAEERNDICVG